MGEEIEVIGAEDVAKLLGVCAATARRHLVAGIIPGWKVGRRWVTSKQKVIELIETGNTPKGDGDHEQGNRT